MYGHTAAQIVPAAQQAEMVERLTNLKSQLQYEIDHRLRRDHNLTEAAHVADADVHVAATFSSGIPSGLIDCK